MKRLPITLGFLILFSAAPAIAVPATLHPTRVAFEAAFPGLPVEDFEEAVQGFGGLQNTFGVMGNPLDSSTLNTFFSPGQIRDGLRLTANNVAGVAVDNLLVAAPGYRSNPSHAISYNDANTSSPEMTILFFNDNVNAVGLDLTSPGLQDVIVSLFSGGNSLGNFVVNDLLTTGTFFGASSTDTITRLTISGRTINDDFFSVDNIAFGPAPVPEAGQTFALLLASTLLLGAVGWKAKSAV